MRFSGWAWEKTNSGVYESSMEFILDMLSERVQLNENVLVPDTCSTPTGRRAFLTHQDSSGPLEFWLDTTVASIFLPAVLGECTPGASKVTCAIVPTANRKTLPSLSATINSTKFLRKIAGAGVKRVTIRSDGGPGNLPTLQVELVGGTETRDAPDATKTVGDLNELGKILANTTCRLYLADEDLPYTTMVNHPIKTKSFEVTIEPQFKEDPIIGTEGLDPELYVPESWRIRASLTVPYTAGAGASGVSPGTVQWLARYMGADNVPDADGIVGAVTRVWDLMKSTKIPLAFEMKFTYDTTYNLQINIDKAIIIDPPDYNEEGKVIKDVGLVLEALYNYESADKTIEAVIGTDTTGAADLPGYVAPT